MIGVALVAAAAAVHVVPTRATVPPRLDGRLDDAAWTAAAPFTALVQKDPDAGQPPSEPTSIRFLYTDREL